MKNLTKRNKKLLLLVVFSMPIMGIIINQIASLESAVIVTPITAILLWEFLKER